jgi:hypothetical protein
MAGIAVLLKHHSRRVSSLPAEPPEEGVDERRGAATDVDDVVVGPRPIVSMTSRPTVTRCASAHGLELVP